MIAPIDVVEAWASGAPQDVHPWRRRKYLRDTFTEDIAAAVERLPSHTAERICLFLEDLFYHPYFSFEPRPEITGVDEQPGYIESDSYCTVCLGGNGSGKTHLGAIRTTQFLERTAPPAKDAPYWVIGPTYDISCGACWSQKLRNIIPNAWIDWDRIKWLDAKKGWPDVVPLKPIDGLSPSDPRARNWSIGFRSYEQGREKMQGWSIAGAWFTEQFPEEVFNEVERGMREFNRGGMVKSALTMEFTPIDPAKAVYMEAQYDKWQDGDLPDWSFYKFHTEAAMKAGHVGEEWFRNFFATVSDEIRETRLAGVFASYEGIIYPQFSQRIHVREFDLPWGIHHRRAIDWGSSEEHAFVCLWGARDSIGTWYIYDELYCTDQRVTWGDLVKDIKGEENAAFPDRGWMANPGGKYGQPQRRQRWDYGSGLFGTTWAPPDQAMGKREFSRLGIPISGARVNVLNGIESVRNTLKLQPWGEPGIVIHPRCVNLIRELRTYRWLRSSENRLNPTAAKPEPLKKDDHCVDALRYLIHSEVSIGGGGKALQSYKTRRNGLIQRR